MDRSRRPQGAGERSGASEVEESLMQGNIKKLRIKPFPPFDFDLSCLIFTGGDPQIRSYDGEKYWQVLGTDKKTALVIIRSTGTVDEPRLAVELKSEKELSPADVTKAKRTINSLFNLDMDLIPFYKTVKNDRVMARVAKNLYGLKSPTTQTVFEALIDSIVEQQISLIAARAMQVKLIKAFGDRLMIGGKTYYAFPTPAKLAGATLPSLRTCGLSGKKSEYIKDVSALIASGELDLEKFEAYESSAEIIEELSRIRGIGVWTSEMTMIRGLEEWTRSPPTTSACRLISRASIGRAIRLRATSCGESPRAGGSGRGLAGYYLIVAHRMGLE